MRIIDAEPQLIEDFVDEIEVIVTKENPSVIVQAGRHPVLGKVVVIESKNGGGLIIEMDE